ncbi:cytochrome P450 [Aquincola sp. S2]|uniref:Cytochrome P450 n=1 Tax=Pseudaquabacterium terrae TaxID=2732868 RepID=A0ABX2EMU6_9BURK|nr:cytochrome P450 [Aquabacterium terrae]NRF70005.1 cytochrome P450 [Aquabacterium terrae]
MNPDPYTHYARMRATTPVSFNPALQMWEVYRYADIQSVLADPATFSSDLSAYQTMATMDPPRHTQLRKLVARAFTSKLMASLEPSIQAITDALLDRVEHTGRMDAIADLAFALPVTVIAELLGLPASDRERFKQWSVPAIRVAEAELHGQPPEPEWLAAVDELMAYLGALAEQRRSAPREDLISGLVHAEIDGARLTAEEITSTCRLLLIAGFETTANLIGNTLQLLLAHPAALERVRSDPEQLAGAIDESLRFHAPFQFFARKATRDVTIGGQAIAAGQVVLIFNASGNRDESVFDKADEFDIGRSPNRHLSFGHGIHYCLGAGLGRMEARIGIGTLLRRFPALHVDAAQPAERLQSIVLYGWRSLPLSTGDRSPAEPPNAAPSAGRSDKRCPVTG